MIELTNKPIDVAKLVATAQQPSAGAVVLFLGITREFTEGKQTTTLYYEAYEAMAHSELTRLHDEACKRWPLVECRLIHRLGEVPLTETSVAVVASAPHRDAAFAAARWLIDNIKLSVPIWKQEHWSDGTQEWVHPGKKQDG